MQKKFKKNLKRLLICFLMFSVTTTIPLWLLWSSKIKKINRVIEGENERLFTVNPSAIEQNSSNRKKVIDKNGTIHIVKDKSDSLSDSTSLQKTNLGRNPNALVAGYDCLATWHRGDGLRLFDLEGNLLNTTKKNLDYDGRIQYSLFLDSAFVFDLIYDKENNCFLALVLSEDCIFACIFSGKTGAIEQIRKLSETKKFVYINNLVSGLSNWKISPNYNLGKSSYLIHPSGLSQSQIFNSNLLYLWKINSKQSGEITDLKSSTSVKEKLIDNFHWLSATVIKKQKNSNDYALLVLGLDLDQNLVVKYIYLKQNNSKISEILETKLKLVNPFSKEPIKSSFSVSKKRRNMQSAKWLASSVLKFKEDFWTVPKDKATFKIMINLADPFDSEKDISTLVALALDISGDIKTCKQINDSSTKIQNYAFNFEQALKEKLTVEQIRANFYARSFEGLLSDSRGAKSFFSLDAQLENFELLNNANTTEFRTKLNLKSTLFLENKQGSKNSNRTYYVIPSIVNERKPKKKRVIYMMSETNGDEHVFNAISEINPALVNQELTVALPMPIIRKTNYEIKEFSNDLKIQRSSATELLNQWETTRMQLNLDILKTNISFLLSDSEIKLGSAQSISENSIKIKVLAKHIYSVKDSWENFKLERENFLEIGEIIIKLQWALPIRLPKSENILDYLENLVIINQTFGSLYFNYDLVNLVSIPIKDLTSDEHLFLSDFELKYSLKINEDFFIKNANLKQLNDFINNKIINTTTCLTFSKSAINIYVSYGLKENSQYKEKIQYFKDSKNQKQYAFVIIGDKKYIWLSTEEQNSVAFIKSGKLTNLIKSKIATNSSFKNLKWFIRIPTQWSSGFSLTGDNTKQKTLSSTTYTKADFDRNGLELVLSYNKLNDKQLSAANKLDSWELITIDYKKLKKSTIYFYLRAKIENNDEFDISFQSALNYMSLNLDPSIINLHELNISSLYRVNFHSFKSNKWTFGYTLNEEAREFLRNGITKDIISEIRKRFKLEFSIAIYSDEKSKFIPITLSGGKYFDYSQLRSNSNRFSELIKDSRVALYYRLVSVDSNIPRNKKHKYKFAYDSEPKPIFICDTTNSKEKIIFHNPFDIPIEKQRFTFVYDLKKLGSPIKNLNVTFSGKDFKTMKIMINSKQINQLQRFGIDYLTIRARASISKKKQIFLSDFKNGSQDIDLSSLISSTKEEMEIYLPECLSKSESKLQIKYLLGNFNDLTKVLSLGIVNQLKSRYNGRDFNLLVKGNNSSNFELNLKKPLEWPKKSIIAKFRAEFLGPEYYDEATFKSKIKNHFAEQKWIKKEEFNIYMKLVLETGVTESLFNWNQSEVKIYNQGKICLDPLFYSDSRDIKMMLSIDWWQQNYILGLKTNNSKKTTINFSSSSPIKSFNASELSEFGVDLEYAISSRDNPTNWIRLTKIPFVLNQSIKNKKVWIRLNNISRIYHFSKNSKQELKSDNFKIQIRQLLLTSLTKHISAIGDTHNLKIIIDKDLYSISPEIINQETFDKIFEIKYRLNSRSSWLSAEQFEAHVNSLRGAELNQLDIKSFQVGLALKNYGKAKYIFSYAFNFPRVRNSMSSAINVSKLKKAYDVTELMNLIETNEVSGNLERLSYDLYFLKYELQKINRKFNFWFGRYKKDLNSNKWTYVWEKELPSKLETYSIPNSSFSNYPLAITISSKSPNDSDSDNQFYISKNGEFSSLNLTKGIQLDLSKLKKVFKINNEIKEKFGSFKFSGTTDLITTTVEDLDVLLEDFDSVWKSKIGFKFYWFDKGRYSEKKTLEDFKNQIQNHAKKYGEDHLSLITFWYKTGQVGKQILIMPYSKDPDYLLLGASSYALAAGMIKTKLDFSSYVNCLKTQITKVETISDTDKYVNLVLPILSGKKESGFLVGRTINEIIFAFSQVGITTSFNITGAGLTDEWVPYEKVRQLTEEEGIQIRFSVNSEAKKNVFSFIGLENEEAIQLKLANTNLVEIPASVLQQIKISGNTKEIIINTKNLLNDPLIAQNQNAAKISWKFAIGKSATNLLELVANQKWFYLSKFEQALRNWNQPISDEQLNIYVQFSKAEGIADNDPLLFSDLSVVSLDTKNLKRYIEITSFFNYLLANPKAMFYDKNNNSTNVATNNVHSFSISLEKKDDLKELKLLGVDLEYTTDRNCLDEQNKLFVKWYKYPNRTPLDLGFPPFLAIRLAVRNSNSCWISATIKNSVIQNNGIYTHPIVISTDNLIQHLNVELDKLSLIDFSGTTRDIFIDETRLWKALPNWKKYLSVKYSIHRNGLVSDTEQIWRTKEEFKTWLTGETWHIFLKRANSLSLHNIANIEMKFVLNSSLSQKEKYVLSSSQNKKIASAEQLENLKTYVDFTNLVNQLKNGEISFNPGDKANKITKIFHSNFDNETKNSLAKFGITLKYSFGAATAYPSNPNDDKFYYNWIDQFGSNSYETTDLGIPKRLWLKFFIISEFEKYFHVVNNTAVLKIGDDLPIPEVFSVIFENLAKINISSSTADLIIDDSMALTTFSKEKSVVNEYKDKIEIKYNLNNKFLDSKNPTKSWFTKTELIDLVKTSTELTIADLDNIYAKYFLKSEISATKLVLINDIATKVNSTKTKLMIDVGTYYRQLNTNKVSFIGENIAEIKAIEFPFDSTTNLSFMNLINSKFIKLLWKTAALENKWNEYNFTNNSLNPSSLDPLNPKLWFKIESANTRISIAEEFTDAIDVTPNVLNIQYSVSLVDIKDNIKISGNTKNINIAGEEFLSLIYPKLKYLKLEYSIGNPPLSLDPSSLEITWFNSIQFKNLLLLNKTEIWGAHRVIRARYSIDEQKAKKENPTFAYKLKLKETTTSIELKLDELYSYINLEDIISRLKIEQTNFADGDTSEHLSQILLPLEKNVLEQLFITDGPTRNIFSKKLKLELATNLNGPLNFDRYFIEKLDNYENIPTSLQSDGKGLYLMARFSKEQTSKITFDPENNQLSKSREFRLNVKLKATINLDFEKYFAVLKNTLLGNTKNLIIDSEIETRILAQIKNDKGNLEIPISIQYSIGKKPIKLSDKEDDDGWYLKEDFLKLLATNKNNLTTNQIQARFYISENNDKYKLSQKDPVVLHPENFSATTKVKIYIHTNNLLGELVKTTMSGEASNYSVILKDAISFLPNGLELVWTTLEQATIATINDAKKWSLIKPEKLDPKTNHYLAIAIRSKDGYVFEANLVKKNRIFILDKTNIFSYLKLEKKLLKSIIFSGNTFESEINEDVFWILVANNVLAKYLSIEYSVDQINWFKRKDFIDLLKTKAGALDQDNFILLREKIMARYALSEKGYKLYRLKIDTFSFDETKEANNPKTYISCIQDNQDNSNYKGYINLTLLPSFIAENFRIFGTTKNWDLEILEDKLKKALEPYQNYPYGKRAFEIYYSVRNSKNIEEQFQFEDKYSIFGRNGFMNPSFIDTISFSKFFSIIIVPNEDYVLSDTNHLNGQKIQINNIDIQILLDSPLIKPVELKFSGYNGQGKMLIEYDNQNLSDFLDNWEFEGEKPFIGKYSIEIHVSENKYSKAEIISLNNDNSKWSEYKISELSSNFKVGQYVLVRVKFCSKTFLVVGTEKANSKQTRVSSLSIHMSDLEISDKITYINQNFSYIDQLVDGDIGIENTSIQTKHSAEEEAFLLYLEVDLDFYIANNRIARDYKTTLPLIRREISKTWLDLDREDDFENKILVYTDENGIPTKPIKSKLKKLIPLTQRAWLVGSFFQEKNAREKTWLFNNQNFKIIAKLKEDYIPDNLENSEISKSFTITGAKYPVITEQSGFQISSKTQTEIEYKSAYSPIPRHGSAFISSEIVLDFFSGKQRTSLYGQEALEKLKRISRNKLALDLHFRPRKNREIHVHDSIDIKQFKNLENGDQIIISIVSSDPRFIYLNSTDFRILVKTLLRKAPSLTILKNLRVLENQDSKTENGSGSFRVTVDPNASLYDENNDRSATLLENKYAFVYRVWDLNNKVLKTISSDSNGWSRKFPSGLRNGNRVEWKLISIEDDLEAELENSYLNSISIRKSKNSPYFARVLIDGNGRTEIDGELETSTSTKSGFIFKSLADVIYIPEEFKSILEDMKLEYCGINGFGKISYSNKLKKRLKTLLDIHKIKVIFKLGGKIIEQDDEILSNGDQLDLSLKYVGLLKDNINNNVVIKGLNNYKKEIVSNLATPNNLAKHIINTVLITSAIVVVLSFGAIIFYRRMRYNKLMLRKK